MGLLEALESVVTFLHYRLGEIGLKINFSKCHLLTVGETTHLAAMQVPVRYALLEVEHE